MLKLPLKFRQQKEIPPDPKTNYTAEGRQVVVRIENVRKTYANGFEGLKGISLELLKGDFLFVTGHSGSGKSTLLKLLYGAEQVTDGDVFVNGF
ncbi:MAG: ATP-binding cassette domain-containing protein [Pseudanabaena sp. CRU_2_10]|nr:ATP-binding cassette domain-containing protein [Pseudanabaena sp. CRU_2_10]